MNLRGKVRTKILEFENNMMMRMAGVKNESPKMESGNELLSNLGLVIVAVVLLIIFRREIVSLFDSAIGSAKTNVIGLFGDALGGTEG